MPKYKLTVIIAPDQDPATAVTRALAKADGWGNGDLHEEIAPFLARTRGKPRVEVLREATRLVTVKELT